MLLLPRLASSNLKAGSWNAASGNRSPAPAQKTLLRQAFPGVFAFLLLLSLDRAARATERSVDFHFAPPEWQTAICFPDDPDKSLVDRNGDLLYHYGKGGREFGTRVGVIVDTNAVWTSQDLTSPRVPIVRTTFQAGDLEILQEAFAVPETSVNSPVKGTTETKATRKDMLLVRVKNNGPKARTLAPELVVDTTLAFKFSPEAQCIEVNEHECITSSLRLVALASGESARRSVRVADITVPAGRTIEFFILYSNGDSKPGERLTQASAKRMREGAVRFWLEAALPYGRIEVPDQSVQALIDSSIRNIWQAREIKKGLPAFQVGPTCYRGLWIVDGAFLLEAAALLGAGDQARSGVAYELTYQRRDGSIHVMDNYYKENGIVLWTCVRHAQLTQDKAWLEKKWPELERIALYIKSLRQQTITNSSPRDDGLLPAGFPDGGIGGVIDEYTNPYWN
ncbi:MAG TPA: hypothetical protein VL793_12275, partial [Patescibacteria group bacterium]|nr:hypothetical protein [Patescibacteria group bacterium]